MKKQKKKQKKKKKKNSRHGNIISKGKIKTSSVSS